MFPPGVLNSSTWPVAFFQPLALVVSATAGQGKIKSFPIGRDAPEAWVLKAFLQSTRGMAKHSVAHFVADKISKILGPVEPSQEMAHLWWLTEFVDFKSSEERLKDGSILDGCRQAIPYLACIWDWSCIQSYSSSVTQHTNVLELLAFFKFLSFMLIRFRSMVPIFCMCSTVAFVVVLY